MRPVHLCVLSALLVLWVPLGGCMTFCDAGDPDPSDWRESWGAPLSERESHDERGRRCTTVTIFDVVDAVRDGDGAP